MFFFRFRVIQKFMGKTDHFDYIPSFQTLLRSVISSWHLHSISLDVRLYWSFQIQKYSCKDHHHKIFATLVSESRKTSLAKTQLSIRSSFPQTAQLNHFEAVLSSSTCSTLQVMCNSPLAVLASLRLGDFSSGHLPSNSVGFICLFLVQISG